MYICYVNYNLYISTLLTKLLFITDNFPPEFNAPSTRTFDHISEWKKHPDFDITVITCFPNFPFGKVYKGYKNKLISIKNQDGIRLIRVWSFISKNSFTNNLFIR